MAACNEDSEQGTILLENPVYIIFKRKSTTGRNVMIMLWLPIELIKDILVIIYDSDIFTAIELKDDLKIRKF